MEGFNLENLEIYSEILKAMAHPIRLCILKGLYLEGEKNVTTMQECLNVPQSTVSQHLSILRNKGIIKGKRNGLEVSYSFTDEVVRRIIRVIIEESQKKA